MPGSQKRNALIIVGLAALFHGFFMLTKHSPAFRNLIPFGNDPYDAVGSFADIAGVLIALLCVVRAFRPYRNHPPTWAQQFYLVRAQMAVVLAVFVTLMTDATAMVRHPSAWMHAASRIELLTLLASMAAITIAVGALVRFSLEGSTNTTPSNWMRATLVLLVSMFVLAIYPESLIANTTMHLVTVVIGDLLLFGPLAALLVALVPVGRPSVAKVSETAQGGVYGWILVTLIGLTIGTLLFVAEITDGGGPIPRFGRLVIIACVYAGLTIVGLLIAYVFLSGPLGLRRLDSVERSASHESN